MRLMTPERWLDRYFEEGSRPSMQVLQRLLREGNGRRLTRPCAAFPSGGPC